MYREGKIPDDFKTSTAIPIPKKSNSMKCEDYRTISLMSHTLKLLLGIVNRRIEKKLDDNLSKTQFGFRPNTGTRDAIALYRLLIQRALTVNRNLYVCYVDYEKAFDRVEHQQLPEVLEKYGLDREDVRLIQALYWEQRANVRIGKFSSETYCKIEKGVRQGCPLSPRLFNIYAEQIGQHPRFQRAGFKIKGQIINQISYADDKVIIARTAQQLQRMVRQLDREGRKYGMKINTSKTKVMVLGKNVMDKKLIVEIDNAKLDQVQQFKYLGAVIQNDGRDETEIRCRIAAARSAFQNMEKVLRDRKMNIHLRLRILNCYVWSILRYSSETWTMTKATERRINAFELWCYRKMHRVAWTEKKKNIEILQKMGLDGTILLNMITAEKNRCIAMKMEDDTFKLVSQGKILCKKSRGRKRYSILSNSMQE